MAPRHRLVRPPAPSRSGTRRSHSIFGLQDSQSHDSYRIYGAGFREWPDDWYGLCPRDLDPALSVTLGWRTPIPSTNGHLQRGSSYKSPQSPQTNWVVMFLLTRFLTIALGLTSVSARNCRCTSASRCWPSDSEFKTLASKVSQPLIHPIPPATPCYDSAAGNCTDVIANWHNSTWRSDQPGAAELTNYETYTFPNRTIQGCYLNTTLGIPCQQGNVPVIGVDARTPEDIQEAVRFAGNHNLRLVIKNTGYVSPFVYKIRFPPR